jgi:hypothetical protein
MLYDICRKSACYNPETSYNYMSAAWWVLRCTAYLFKLRYSKPLDDTESDVRQANLILCQLGDPSRPIMVPVRSNKVR